MERGVDLCKDEKFLPSIYASMTPYVYHCNSDFPYSLISVWTSIYPLSSLRSDIALWIFLWTQSW